MAIKQIAPHIQATNDFEIDASAADVVIAEVSPNGEACCSLYVSNDDDSVCAVAVVLADKPADETPTIYRVPSGSWLPIQVRLVAMTGTAADTILGQISKSR